MRNNAIALYEPINLLKQVGEDIWIVDGSIMQMAMYGTKVPFHRRSATLILADLIENFELNKVSQQLH